MAVSLTLNLSCAEKECLRTALDRMATYEADQMPGAAWASTVSAQLLANIDAAIAAPASPRRIVISVEGGMVTGLSADGPVAAVITDYDTENSDEADLTDIPGTGMGGPPARAGIEFIAAECDPAFVAAVHALGDDDDCPNTEDGKHAYVTRAKDGVCACDTCGKVHPAEGNQA